MTDSELGRIDFVGELVSENALKKIAEGLREALTIVRGEAAPFKWHVANKDSQANVAIKPAKRTQRRHKVQ